MKLLVVFITLVAYAACADDKSCYNDIHNFCKSDTTDEGILKNCDAKYGAAAAVFPDLQKYANQHISRSFEYLLMSTHFGNYEKSRQGFEKLYRKLSDSTWDDAIDLIKYIAKRGGSMDFNTRGNAKSTKFESEINELASLGRAVDTQKVLAEEAHRIHGLVIRRNELHHDPEVSSFIENHFVHKHAESIRELSGHSNDLKRLLSDKSQTSLSLFLFDEYLQKL